MASQVLLVYVTRGFYNVVSFRRSFYNEILSILSRIFFFHFILFSKNVSHFPISHSLLDDVQLKTHKDLFMN